MSTVIVFLMTLGQLIAVVVGYTVPIPTLFDALVNYGSPLYFIFNLISSNSVIAEEHIWFPLLAAFHVFKYMFLCRSQFIEERHSLHYMAVIFEIMYLVVCAYYL